MAVILFLLHHAVPSFLQWPLEQIFPSAGGIGLQC